MSTASLTFMPDTFPLVRQYDAADCGAACLTMIARHFGLPITLGELRDRIPTGAAGATMHDLINAAQETGFETRALYVPFDALHREIPVPFVAHWREQHYIVVYRVTETEVHFADPAVGKRTLPRAQFERNWLSKNPERVGTGRVLVFQPGAPLQQALTKRKAPPVSKIGFGIRRLFKIVGSYRREILTLLLAMTVSVVSVVLIPLLIRTIVDFGIEDQRPQLVVVLSLAILFLVAGYYFLRTLRAAVLRFVGVRVNFAFFRDFLLRLTDLPLQFFSSRFTNDILHRLEDPATVERFFGTEIPRFLFAAVHLIGLSWVLWYFRPLIFGVYVCGTVIYFAVAYWLRRRGARDERNREYEQLETGYLLDEMVHGMADLKINNATTERRQRWENNELEREGRTRRYLRSLHRRDLFTSVLADLRNLGITLLAAFFAVEGSISLGTLLAVQYVLGQLNEPSIRLLHFFDGYRELHESLRRMDDVYERQGKTLGAETELPPEGDLRLENVSFVYPGSSRPVLENIDLEIPEGTTLAVVGSSGSGKTTLVKILMGIYSPTSGTATVGGQSIAELNADHWFARTGAVLQDGFIFTDTLVANVALGDPNPDRDRVLDTLETVQLLEETERWPDGVDTTIGRMGRPLSQGQRQRVLLARALYRQPFFLFLDEATNALDTRNEALIARELNHFLSGRTAVVVAHRLNTILHADTIVVLEDGQIVERGTHTELLRMRGHYYQLIKGQLV